MQMILQSLAQVALFSCISLLYIWCMVLSVVFICRTKDNRKSLKVPDFKLSNNNLEDDNEVKKLVHFITEQMTDDDDIYRKCRSMYTK